MIMGGMLAGNVNADGEIRNLCVKGSPATVASWIHEGAAGHNYLIGIDGNLEGIAAPGATSYVTIAPEGEHRFSLEPIRPETRHLPDLHGDPYGNTVYLNWLPSNDEDVRSYRIYRDGVLVAGVSGTRVEAEQFVSPSGSGTGRVSIAGAWNGSTTNKTFALSITPSGFAQNIEGAAVVRFAQGGTYSLPSGVSVTFLDPSGYYQDGDTWHIKVGPPTFWQSEALSSGTYSFDVRPVDFAGNEGAGITKSIAVIPRPAPVRNASVSWDGTEIALSWLPPLASGIDGYRIYSNWSLTYEALQDYIILDAPWETLSFGTNSLSFAPSGLGWWRFYVRSVDTSGRENASVEMLSVNAADIPTSIELVSPESLAVVPGPSGSAILSWDYNWNEGGHCNRFYFYSSATPSGIEADMAADTALSFDAVPSGSNFLSYSKTFSTDFAALGSERFFGIRSAYGTIKTTNADYVGFSPDATAPDLGGALEGASN